MSKQQILYELNEDINYFPNYKNILDDGLLAIGGDLNPHRVLNAYKKGIFPWFGADDPILWWSPNPRLILMLDDFKISKSLKRVIKSGKYEVRIDTAFEEVINNCKNSSRKNQNGTWINDGMINAYISLHKMGYAHSYETYYDGKLVGGLYGLSIGKVFCGESMFALMSDASKVAFNILVQNLKNDDFAFIDAQVPTEHLKSLGAIEVTRDQFLLMLNDKI